MGKLCLLVTISVSSRVSMHTFEMHMIEEMFVQSWANWAPNIVVETELWCDNIILHAHPCCKKKAWCDWVAITWIGHGQSCAKLWGFVDSLCLPPNIGAQHGSCKLQPSMHVETKEATKKSDLFVPVKKEMDINEVLLGQCRGFLKACSCDSRCWSPPGFLFFAQGLGAIKWKQEFVQWSQVLHNLDKMVTATTSMAQAATRKHPMM